MASSSHCPVPLWTCFENCSSGRSNMRRASQTPRPDPQLVSGGDIGPNGDPPVNTNDGGLSCCLPGLDNAFLLIGAERLLRAERSGG
jgi:hypothetical protein